MLQKIKTFLKKFIPKGKRKMTVYEFKVKENDKLLGRYGATLIMIKQMADIKKEKEDQPKEFEDAYKEVCDSIKNLSNLLSSWTYREVNQ